MKDTVSQWQWHTGTQLDERHCVTVTQLDERHWYSDTTWSETHSEDYTRDLRRIFVHETCTCNHINKQIRCIDMLACTFFIHKEPYKRLWSVFHQVVSLKWIMESSVMSNTWMSHVAHMNESCHTYEWVMSHIWMSHVARTYEWVISHITHMNESCRMDEWVMSHKWMSHVAHMNESCRTYQWVVSHIWMSHVAHMNESCRTCE